MKWKRRAWAAVALVLLFVMVAGTAGCGRSDHVPHWRVEVVGTRLHDRGAFTEGLELDGDVLYESTGLVGDSGVRALNPATGAVLARADVPPPYFGEGITRSAAILWELTWQNGTAFARDPVTLAEIRQVHYSGEGWGLCTRRDHLVMSNGSSTLTFRDPVGFDVTGTIRLTSHKNARLNELDCAADGSVYANVWPTDEILRIDPDTGAVLADIDASRLLTPLQQAGTDVLNGIAQIPGTDHFLVTGKRWPVLLEVRFVAA